MMMRRFAACALAATFALTGCKLLRPYTLDKAKAEAYRAKYLPGCRTNADALDGVHADKE